MSRRNLTDEEKKLLKSAMKDVVPLHGEAVLEEEMPAPKRHRLPKKIMRAASPPKEEKPATGGAVDKPTIERVKRGEYVPEARLDLHGMTLEEAFGKLSAFVEESVRKQRRCVLVITGKGGKDGKMGALQREVPRWLSLSSLSRQLLVVSSASPKHGGQGAYYLLLKRKKI